MIEFLTDFRKVSVYIYYISQNSSGCSSIFPCEQKDGKTHLTKLIADFRRLSYYWCILSFRCNTHKKNRMFSPQYPTAVSSEHSSKSHV